MQSIKQLFSGKKDLNDKLNYQSEYLSKLDNEILDLKNLLSCQTENIYNNENITKIILTELNDKITKIQQAITSLHAELEENTVKINVLQKISNENSIQSLNIFNNNTEKIWTKLEAIHYWPNQNLKQKIYMISALESAQFVIEKMNKVPSFLNNLKLLEFSLNQTNIDGLFMEFGVYKGKTINYIAKKKQDKMIFGFDCFEGLPETWRTEFEAGQFKIDKLPVVDKNVKLIKGYFENTLPIFVKEYEEKIAFMHIDSDLYSSAKCILQNMKDKLQIGTIIVFDEFFNYPGWKEGEYKALLEFSEETNIKFDYIGYVETHEQVAIKITNL